MESFILYSAYSGTEGQKIVAMSYNMELLKNAIPDNYIDWDGSYIHKDNVIFFENEELEDEGREEEYLWIEKSKAVFIK